MHFSVPREAGDALLWSIKAMDAATERVNRIPASDLPAGFAAIGESLWWITIVDDTLKRQYPTEYKQAFKLTFPDPKDTLDCLRSVRNRVGHEVDLVTLIEPVASRPDRGDGRITAWAWRSVSPPKRRDDRFHRAYEGALAGQTSGSPSASLQDSSVKSPASSTARLATQLLNTSGRDPGLQDGRRHQVEVVGCRESAPTDVVLAMALVGDGFRNFARLYRRVPEPGCISSPLRRLLQGASFYSGSQFAHCIRDLLIRTEREYRDGRVEPDSPGGHDRCQVQRDGTLLVVRFLVRGQQTVKSGSQVAPIPQHVPCELLPDPSSLSQPPPVLWRSSGYSDARLLAAGRRRVPPAPR